MARRKSKKNKAVRSRTPEPSIPETQSPVKLKRNRPAWFHRVSDLVASRAIDGFGHYEVGPHSEDFDEDISDPDFENDDACQCPSDASDCGCGYDSDDFDNSDNYQYEEWKEMRDDRKRLLSQLAEERAPAIEYAKEQEEKVGKALTEARERQKQGAEGQELDLKNGHFKIYSADYIRALPLDTMLRTTYIEFYRLDEWIDGYVNRNGLAEPINGHLYFHADNSPHLDEFEAIPRASMSNHKFGVQDSDLHVTVKLFTWCYLKLIVPRAIALPESSPPNGTPDFLEFVGIRWDMEEEKKKRKMEAKKRKREEDEQTEARQKRREVSPR